MCCCRAATQRVRIERLPPRRLPVRAPSPAASALRAHARGRPQYALDEVRGNVKQPRLRLKRVEEEAEETKQRVARASADDVALAVRDEAKGAAGPPPRRLSLSAALSAQEIEDWKSVCVRLLRKSNGRSFDSSVFKSWLDCAKHHRISEHRRAVAEAKRMSDDVDSTDVATVGGAVGLMVAARGTSPSEAQDVFQPVGMVVRWRDIA